MVDCTKVLCPLFVELKILIPVNISPRIFPYLDKMYNCNSLQKRRKTTVEAVCQT